MSDYRLQAWEKKTIYQGARKLVSQSEQIVGGMSKVHKFTLGTRLANRISMLYEIILRSYLEETDIYKKRGYVKAINSQLDYILFTYRVMEDLHQIRKDQYIAQVDLIIYLKERADAWYDSLKPKSAHDQSAMTNCGVSLSRTTLPSKDRTETIESKEENQMVKVGLRQLRRVGKV